VHPPAFFESGDRKDEQRSAERERQRLEIWACGAEGVVQGLACEYEPAPCPMTAE